VSIAIRLVQDSFTNEFPVVTLIPVIMCGLALITEALGVQTVLGAFVASVLIGESPILTAHLRAAARDGRFFLRAGILRAGGIEFRPRGPRVAHIALLAAGLILVARAGNRGRLPRRLDRAAVGSEAVAIGMNASGSTEDRREHRRAQQDLYSMLFAMAC
jgi:hypothetical protein